MNEAFDSARFSRLEQEVLVLRRNVAELSAGLAAVSSAVPTPSAFFPRVRSRWPVALGLVTMVIGAGAQSSDSLSINPATGAVSIGGALTTTGQINAGNSDLYFTNTQHAATELGNAQGRAAIQNASDYGSLMIFGRETPGGRVAVILDRLAVNGDGASPETTLDVNGMIRSKTGGFVFPDATSQLTAAVTIPTGAVVAFALSACPASWTEYAPAYGRFVRGIDKSGVLSDPDGQRAFGATQGDAMRNITGEMYAVAGEQNNAYPWGFRPGSHGALKVNYDGQPLYNRMGDKEYSPSGASGATAQFNAEWAPGVRIANENRPTNVALLYCSKN